MNNISHQKWELPHNSCPFHTELHFWGIWETRHYGWCRHHEVLCAHCLNPAVQGLLPRSRVAPSSGHVHPSLPQPAHRPPAPLHCTERSSSHSCAPGPGSATAGPGCCQHLKAQLWGARKSTGGAWDVQPSSAGALGEEGTCWVLSIQLQAPPAQPGAAPHSLRYPSPWLQLGFVPAQHVDISISSSWSQPRSRAGEEQAAAIFNLLDQHPATSTAASAPLCCCSTSSPPHTSHSPCQPISSISYSWILVFRGSLPPAFQEWNVSAPAQTSSEAAADHQHS